jgi:GAF domain-containing protein
MLSWLWQRIRGAIDNAVERSILIALAAAIFLLWKFASGHIEMPIWVFAIAVGVPLTLAAMAGLRGRQPASVAASYIGELERQNALYGYYASFLWEVMQTLQKAIRGDIPGVTIDELVEQGILAPARELLRQAPGEDVRLSVLVPEGQDFVMRWAAGHRLASKQNFRMRIGDSFSRFAYTSGEIVYSEDVDVDPRFRPHPRAERPYRSIISLPIRSGEDVVAAFNVVSTLPFAFTLADFIFVALAGAVIDVSLALGEPPPIQPELEQGDEDQPYEGGE